MDASEYKKLFEANTLAWDGEYVFPLKSSKLDSSIKRNTGFIKKLKQGINKDTKVSLLKDLGEVSLEKYLSEIINTSNESMSNISNKPDDIMAVIEVTSGLHQRFGPKYTPFLTELFLDNFSSPKELSMIDKNETSRINKVRVNIRLFCELYLIGVFRSMDYIEPKSHIPEYLLKKNNKKSPLILSILKEVLNHRFKEGYAISVATLIIKRFPIFFSIAKDETDNPIWDEIIFDSNLKSVMDTLFKVFTDAVFARTQDLCTRMGKLLKEHQKCQIRTGKERDEFIDEYDELLPIFERFKAGSQSLGEFFELELPNMQITSSTDDDENSKPMITNPVLPQDQRVWENEETRKFYEVLPAIKDKVAKSKDSNKEVDTSEVRVFFETLEFIETKDEIDELCFQYWEKGLDNKATRKKLLKFLLETQDWTKLRLYARMLATNSEYLVDIRNELVNILDNGFRSQLHSNRINVKNIIFFSEMVKFRLVPIFMIFHKIRSLILNMQIPNNIEILTILFEQLGKFLINHPEFHEQMEKMISLIKEKSKDRHLHMNVKSALDNLIIIIYPPSVKILNSDQKKDTPEQQFLKVLIRRELHNIEPKRVLQLIRSANWKKPEVYSTLFELFTTPKEVSYQYLPKLVKILHALRGSHRNFVIKCVDQVLEDIHRGLERNHYNENMKRVAEVRYLVEMLNLNIVNSEVIIETLYSILKYGYPNGQPVLNYECAYDPPNNYFRIQLVTVVLLNIEHHSNYIKKRLELFLRFFEYYIYIKMQPIPRETEFIVKNSFDKYEKIVNFKRANNMTECVENLMLKLATMKSLNTGKDGKQSDKPAYTKSSESLRDDLDDYDISSDDGSITDDDNNDLVDDLKDSNNGNESLSETSDSDNSSDSDEDASESDSDYSSDEDEKDINADRNVERTRMYEEYRKKLESEQEKKAEEEFEKQFQNMLQESVSSRKSEKIVTTKIPMITAGKPKLLKPNLLRKGVSVTSVDDVGDQDEPKSKVAFTFLTKTGKKTKSQILALPKDVKFVSNVLEEEERLKDEREKIKNIVLQRNFD